MSLPRSTVLRELRRIELELFCEGPGGAMRDDMMGLCHRNLYLRELVDAPSVVHVEAIISAHHQQVRHRPARLIPH